MNNQGDLVLTQSDFNKLSNLMKSAPLEIVEFLEEELSRAIVIADEQLPKDVVAMNSKVSFKDLETGKEMVMTLVYPSDANILENKVSVLTPVGAALIGLKVGQTINWTVPNGKEKRLTVTSVHVSGA